MLLLLHLLQSGAAPYSRANPSCTSPLSHNSHNLNRKSSDESSDKSLLHTVIHASWRQVEAHFTPAPYIYTHDFPFAPYPRANPSCTSPLSHNSLALVAIHPSIAAIHQSFHHELHENLYEINSILFLNFTK